MTGQPATIVSQAPGNDRCITVRFDGTSRNWQPPGVVLLAAAAPEAHAYLRARPSLAAQVLNKIDAVEIAGGEFGSLLHDDPPT